MAGWGIEFRYAGSAGGAAVPGDGPRRRFYAKDRVPVSSSRRGLLPHAHLRLAHRRPDDGDKAAATWVGIITHDSPFSADEVTRTGGAGCCHESARSRTDDVRQGGLARESLVSPRTPSHGRDYGRLLPRLPPPAALLPSPPRFRPDLAPVPSRRRVGLTPPLAGGTCSYRELSFRSVFFSGTRDLWDQNEGMAVVALLRHFGCPCCWELALTLKDYAAERFDSAYDLLGLYFGVGRTFFNPASVKVFSRFDSLKEATKNYTIEATPDDRPSVLQQGGMFVFKGKELLYARKDEGTGDHAPLDDVLNICCKVPVA
ncbi:hypothetical protein ZWY2020_011196 [Hordeum vulgare]|nr:hypothetical protein ZWY2020_011196 [Hordeum vulgare]